MGPGTGAITGDTTPAGGVSSGGVPDAAPAQAFDQAMQTAAADTPAAPATAPAPQQESSGWSWSDIGHTVLDVAGMVPVIGEAADGVNALWYAGEGRWGDAALSAAGMVPFLGSVSSGARLANRAVGAADLAMDAARMTARHGDTAVDVGRTVARNGDEVVDAGRTVTRGADEAAGAGTTAARTGDEAVGTLKGVTHRLPGWELQPLDYVKRTPEDLASLRGAFNSSGRADFAKHIAANNVDDLRAAGLTQANIDRLATGKIPTGYQVHHILPLDDGGTNDFANLVLIRNHPDHKIITNLQNELTDGMRAGDMRQVQWPRLAEPSVVYPTTPGGGAVPVQ